MLGHPPIRAHGMPAQPGPLLRWPHTRRMQTRSKGHAARALLSSVGQRLAARGAACKQRLRRRFARVLWSDLRQRRPA
jgi:hypothetical protein